MSESGSQGTPRTTGQEAAQQAKGRFRCWFWGAIVVMTILTVMLQVIAARVPEAQVSETEASAMSDPAEGPGTEELSAQNLKSLLGSAGVVALNTVKTQIPSYIDVVYAPVYAAVPNYTDYHYSIWGQYVELGAAALGDVGSKLEDRLFDGFEARLGDASSRIDDAFEETFEAELAAGLTTGAPSGAVLGELTRTVLADTGKRMTVTAPVATSAVLGTALSTKLAAGAMTKSIAAKLAIKVTAKTGGKWVAAGSGAGAGAAVCSWTGPGAGLCAAVGGIGAWLLVDKGIMLLDELWTRDEFEADLTRMIDEQKSNHIAAFQQAITKRAVAVQRVSDETVQSQDFTLRELSGEGSAAICAVADDLSERYEALRVTLAARTPASLDAVRALAAEHEGDLSIGLYAQEIFDNLRSANEFKIETVRISGNLPSGYRANRDVTLLLRLGGNVKEIARSSASSNMGFDALATLDVVKEIGVDLPLDLRIEQHRLGFNRYFAGTGKLIAYEGLGRTSGGLRHVIVLTLPVSYDNDASSVDEAKAGGSDRSDISLEIQVSAAALPPLDGVAQCR